MKTLEKSPIFVQIGERRPKVEVCRWIAFEVPLWRNETQKTMFTLKTESTSASLDASRGTAVLKNLLLPLKRV